MCDVDYKHGAQTHDSTGERNIIFFNINLIAGKQADKQTNQPQVQIAVKQ